MTEEELFIVSTFTWSYSRLNSFHICPYEFYQRYMECIKGEGSFFAQVGSFMHKILEMYAKEELSVFELSEYFTEHWCEEVTYAPPKIKGAGDLNEKYFNQCLEYLDNIDLDLSEYEVLGVEKEVHFNIGGYDMIGYIDLLLKDKDGNIIVADHKSHDIKFKKDGSLSNNKKNLEDIEGFKRQLYLYSKAVIEEYGVEPKFLKWNLFRFRKWLEVPFDINEYKEALKWAEDTVRDIESATEFPPHNDFFYCWNLCSLRNSGCPYKVRH